MSSVKPHELYTSIQEVNQDIKEDILAALYDLSPMHPPPWYRRLWSWVRRKLRM